MSTRLSLERMVAAWMADEAVVGGAARPAVRPDPLHDRSAAASAALAGAPQGAPDALQSRVAVGSPTARILLVTLVPLLLLLAGVAAALAVQPSGQTDDWPIFLGDYDRTGVADKGQSDDRSCGGSSMQAGR